MTAAFRLFDPFQVFFDLDGNLASGGSLNFYNAGTTTPANVYGDQALSVNNGSSIAIGTDGRPVHDIWGNQSYRSRLYALDGTLVSDRDNISIPGGGTSLPDLIADYFLSNDGSVPIWVKLLQLPDPTGNANKILSTDGVVYTLIPNSSVTGGSSTLQIGAYLLRWGTGSIPAPTPAGNSATTSYTYPTAFSAIKVVMATCNIVSGLTAIGGIPALTVTSSNAAGFNITASDNDYTSASGGIINATPFSYLAIGLA